MAREERQWVVTQRFSGEVCVTTQMAAKETTSKENGARKRPDRCLGFLFVCSRFILVFYYAEKYVLSFILGVFISV